MFDDDGDDPERQMQQTSDFLLIKHVIAMRVHTTRVHKHRGSNSTKDQISSKVHLIQLSQDILPVVLIYPITSQ